MDDNVQYYKYSKLNKVEDLINNELLKIIDSELADPLISSNFYNTVAPKLQLNQAEHTMLYHEYPKWDLGLSAKVLRQLPSGSTMKSFLFKISDTRNAIAHLHKKKIDDTTFKKLWLRICDLARKLPIPESVLNLIYYENSILVFDKSYDKIIATTRNALEAKNHTAAIGIILYCLNNKKYSNEEEKLGFIHYGYELVTN